MAGGFVFLRKNKLPMKHLSFLLFFSLCVAAYSQDKFPMFSFPGQIEQIVGFDTISITYERPAVRGREIFGGLVPYGKLWRTGASYATNITFSAPVEVGGEKIPAGSYALFTIPGPDDWTLVLNTDYKQYGAFDYDERKDVVRTQMKVQKSPRFYETFTIDIDVIPNNARVYLSWAETTVSFDVQTTADQKVAEFVKDSLLTGLHPRWQEYSVAGEYYLYQNLDLNEALKLTELGIEKGGKSPAYAARMFVLKALGRYEEAIEMGEAAIQYDKEHNIDGGTYFQDNIEKIRALMKE